ncbi:MAG TPA: hypothetical protein VII92_19225 [Anaerolineae bacterium]
MNDLRCYVCGKAATEEFCVASMSQDVDRVFVIHVECVRRALDDLKVCIKVIRSTTIMQLFDRYEK